MEPIGPESITFINTNEVNLQDQFDCVNHKATVKSLDISQYVIVKVNNTCLNDFVNLIKLDLSNNIIFYFENGVFRTLIHLESINLTNNAISEIANGLFETNTKLVSIILNHNLLDKINRDAFLPLEHLEILDLSYNFIVHLFAYCLNCPNLKKLHINNNVLQIVETKAFDHLPNLTLLELSHNTITHLDKQLFFVPTKLEYLSLNNNLITSINMFLFEKLTELHSLNVENNVLKQVLNKDMFWNNVNLLNLNLLGNEVSSVRENVFIKCKSLRVLNLKVSGEFDILTIRDLKYLTDFQLLYKPRRKVILKGYYWSNFNNKLQLKVLKLVFERIEHIKIHHFISLNHLEFLHIECMEPNDYNTHDINITMQMKKLPQLKTLVFKKLNYFLISELTGTLRMEGKPLVHLDLTGLKNGLISNSVFQDFINLEHLNLSFSKIKFIAEFSFKNLINLEHLNLEHSHLASIRSKVFKYNQRLKILNCSHCCIQLIENYSFTNLTNLVTLDLRSNPLKINSQNVFYGISSSALIYLDAVPVIDPDD